MTNLTSESAALYWTLSRQYALCNSSMLIEKLPTSLIIRGKLSFGPTIS